MFLLVNPFGNKREAKTTSITPAELLMDHIMDHMGPFVRSPPPAATKNKDKDPAEEPTEELADETQEPHPKQARKTPKKFL